MQLKDATRCFGRLGLLLPLILIFLAADSAFACPEHTGRVVYRTRSINTRMASRMPATVIRYRGPASYQRCGDSLYGTRGARYVAVRNNGYYTGSRYIAMRGNGARYVAVRNVDDFDVPRVKTRYVAVRRPVYVDSGAQYVAVRRVEPRIRYVAVRRIEPRVRYVAIRHVDIDDDDAPRYVAVRRQINYGRGVRYVAMRRQIDYDPGVRYVAMRTIAPRTKYVALRSVDSGCTRAIALRSCLGDAETTSKRHVVIRTDHLTGTRDVIYDSASDDGPYAVQNDSDETAIDLPRDSGSVTYRDAASSDWNGSGHIAANDLDNTCVSRVAVSNCQPEAVSTRMVSYAPAYHDAEETAALDGAGVTYVAADDIGDACLSTVAVITPREVAGTRTVSYVPVEDVGEDASFVRSQPTYIANNSAVPVPWPRYVALDEDRVYDDLDPTYIAEVEAMGGTVPVNGVDTRIVSYVPVEDTETVSSAPVETVRYVPVDDTDAVSYVPVDDGNVAPVSYVPVDDSDVVDTRTVSYVPADDMNVSTVSYVPVSGVAAVGTQYIAVDDCSPLVSSVAAEPVYVAVDSAVPIEVVDGDAVAGLHATHQAAGEVEYYEAIGDGDHNIAGFA